jgi:hypothetical protein
MTMLALLLTLVLQDNVAREIERLKSDVVAERERAIHTLESIGLPAMPALEMELKSADLETRYRIEALLKSIPRRAALTKVFGPTKRVTYQADKVPFGEVAAALGKSLDEKVRLEGPDPASPVTLDLKDATLWEAFDALADAAKSRYEYRKDGVVYLTGTEPRFPVRYYEQFRVSIVEIKRIDYRNPDAAVAILVVVPEVEYQRNMSPADKYGGWFSSLFEIEQITDEKGRDLKARPPWGPGSLQSRRPFGLQGYYFADASSKTITVEGVGKARFSRGDKQVSLPVEGAERKATVGDVEFTLTGFTRGTDRTTVTIDAQLGTPGSIEPPQRVKKLQLLGPGGKKVDGRFDRASHLEKEFTATYEFPKTDFAPERFVFEWIEEVYALDIPFRLEGIPVPQP